MKSWTNENLSGLLLVMVTIAAVSIACDRIKGLTVRNSQSNKVNRFNYDLPWGFKGADVDADAERQEAFIVVIPDSNQIMIKSVEAEPIDLQQLDEQLIAFVAGKPPSGKIVYIAATYDVEWSAITKVLRELQKYSIDHVKLLVSNEARRSDRYGNTSHWDKSMGDIPEPDRVFEVNIGEQLPSIKISPSGQLTPPSIHDSKTISGGVLNGKATNLPKPAYPDAARAVRASGTANVQVTVDTDGNVVSASAVSGHPLLQAAAVQAARQAKFSPTKLGGVPVRVNGIIVYSFVP
jgi:TonB family protein